LDKASFYEASYPLDVKPGVSLRSRLVSSLLASAMFFALPTAGMTAGQGAKLWADSETAADTALFTTNYPAQEFGDGREHIYNDAIFSKNTAGAAVVTVRKAGTKFTGTNVVLRTTSGVVGLRIVSGASFELSGKSSVSVINNYAIAITESFGTIHGGTTLNVTGGNGSGAGIMLGDDSNITLSGTALNAVDINITQNSRVRPGFNLNGIYLTRGSKITGEYITINAKNISGSDNNIVGILLERKSSAELRHLTMRGVRDGLRANTESTAILSDVDISAENIGLDAAGHSDITVTNGSITANNIGVRIENSTITLNNVAITAGGSGIGAYLTNNASLSLSGGSRIHTEQGAGLSFSAASSSQVAVSGKSEIDATNGYAVVLSGGSNGLINVDDHSLIRGKNGLYNLTNGRGTLVIVANNGSLLQGRGSLGNNATADITLNSKSRWVIDGNSAVTNLYNNDSVVEFAENRFEGNQNGFTKLVVNNNYRGNNGTIIFNVDLSEGGAGDKNDQLVIDGNAYGTTKVALKSRNTNYSLITDNGLKLITVKGSAENGADTFVIAGDYTVNGLKAVVFGAYSYYLNYEKSEDGSSGWWIRSIYEDSTPIDPSRPMEPSTPIDPSKPMEPSTPIDPSKPMEPSTPLEPSEPADPDSGSQGQRVYSAAVPLYEAYPAILQQMNRQSTLHERVGERIFVGGTENGAVDTGFWMRVEGATGHFNTAHSLTGTRYNLDHIKTQFGLDADLLETDNGQLIGGVYVQYGYGKASVKSRYGSGDIKTNAYGVGGTLTWYADNGFYVDGQAHVQWFDSSLYSRSKNGERGFDTYLTTGSKGLGYGFSVETGRHFALSNGWSLTPQAQLSYGHVSVDNFSDMIGVRVRNGRGESLEGRLGVGVERDRTWRSASGDDRGLKFYGIGNVYHEFLDGTSVSVGGEKFARRPGRTSVGVGGGVEYNWGSGKYAVSGVLDARTPFDDFAKSYEVKGSIGFKLRF